MDEDTITPDDSPIITKEELETEELEKEIKWKKGKKLGLEK